MRSRRHVTVVDHSALAERIGARVRQLRLAHGLSQRELVPMRMLVFGRNPSAP